MPSPFGNSANPRLVKLLSAVTATGAGTAADLGDTRDEFSLLVTTTGSPTFSVTFQGSNDGTDWFTLGSAVTSVTSGTAVTGTPARYVRANLTALSGGTLTAELAFSLALGAQAQLPAGSTSTAGILQLDGTAGHIQPIGTSASAGNQGLAADSKHQHAWGQAAPAGFAPANPTGTASQNVLVMMGLGTTCTYTPSGSGLVLVNVTGYGTTATAVQPVGIGGRYGTGTAPVNGAALTGTRFGGVGDGSIRPTAANTFESFALTAMLTLTPSTTYWFDIAISTAVTADVASISNVSMTLVELP